MKKLLSLLLASSLMLAASAQKAVINDANAEKRSIASFSGITVSNGIDIYLSQGDEEGLVVSASETKYRDKIKAEVKDGILTIWYDHGSNISWGISNKKTKAYISFKNINSLKASGASDVIVTGTLKLPELNLHLSGASDMKGQVDIGSLTADISGASDMSVSGRIENLKIDASGASDLKNYGLVVQTCDADASGASDIKITVEKELSATASGASDIIIRGNAVIKKMKQSGASTVRKS